MSPLTAFLFVLVGSIAADCPPGSKYDSYFNKCYQFFPFPMTFLAAEQKCISIGGHLADIQNAFENFYVAGEGGASNFWIGANLLLASNWTWSSSSPMVFTNWASGQPVNTNPCAYVIDSDHTWKTTSCNIQLPFICTTSPNATIPGFCPTQVPSPTCSTSGCPSDAVCRGGYTLYSENCLCYKYYDSKISFSEGNATCVADGGILANAPSKEINDFLTTLPGTDCSGWTCPYIGLTCSDSSVSSCLWSDGSPLGNYTNFNGSPKSSSYALVTNVNVADRGMWEANSDSRYFMCQKASERSSTILEGKFSRHVGEMTMTSQIFDVTQLWCKTLDPQFHPLPKNIYKLNVVNLQSPIEDYDLLAIRARNIKAHTKSANLIATLNQFLKQWVFNEREIASLRLNIFTDWKDETWEKKIFEGIEYIDCAYMMTNRKEKLSFYVYGEKKTLLFKAGTNFVYAGEIKQN